MNVIESHARSTRSLSSGRTLPVAALLLLAAACSAGDTDDSAPLDQSADELGSGRSLVPASDVSLSNIWGGGGAAPIYKLVDDGVSFAASDKWTTFARSAPGAANAAATFGYAGAAAGGAERVVVSYQAWALDGGTGTVRVKLYDGTTLVGIGAPHAVGATAANFSDTFAKLAVKDANRLRTELDFVNTTPTSAGTLACTLIWIDLTPLTAAADAGARDTGTPVTPDAGATDASAPPPDAGPGWKLVWADEFDGGNVDGTKWNVRNNTRNSNELSCLTSRPQNVSVGGGVLNIKGQRESYNCGETRAFTSGYLDTIGKASWTYGKFEMRAILPTQASTSKGMWPAFWLRPNDGGAGEIDIMEAIGSAASDTEYSKSHQTIWYDYNKTYPSQSKSAPIPNGLPSTGYHVYAVEWNPGSLVFTIDGVTVYTRDRTTTSWFDAAFSRPFNIRLNLQVGGSWPGTPDANTDFSKTYAIDYVRVYQK